MSWEWLGWHVVLWPWYVAFGVLGIVLLGRLALAGRRLFTTPLPPIRRLRILAQEIEFQEAETSELRARVEALERVVDKTLWQ